LRLITVAQSARLIDREGTVLHEWATRYGDLPESPENRRVRPSLVGSDGLYWQRAKVLPDGDLIALLNHTHTSPDGVAIL
ncbi:hypothetical protein SB781_39505, partial [Paraburkholderia sp. SIMBA_061]